MTTRIRLVKLAILGLAATITLTPISAVYANSRVLVSAMEGKWTAVLEGNTGCGSNSLFVTFILDAAGSGAGTATIVSHSTGCSDGKLTGQDFSIDTLNTNGRGTAHL